MVAILKVQGPATNWTNSGISLTITQTNNPVSGNVNIMCLSLGTKTVPPATISSVVQTGVTWSLVLMKLNGTVRGYIYIGIVGDNALKTITINFTGASGSTFVNAGTVCEYNGLDTDDYLDRTASNSGTGTTSDTGTTLGTQKADELWIGNVGAFATANVTQSNPTNGFTLYDGANHVQGAYNGSSAYLELIVSAVGTANSGTTIANSAVWAGLIATFKAAVSAVAHYVTVTEYLGGLESFSRTKSIHRSIMELLGLKDNPLAYPVVNVSHSYAIRWQDKVFYVKGRYWVFWVDTDNYLHYKTSSDGQNWSPTIDLVATNYKYGETAGVIWDGIYFHIHVKKDQELYLRIGEPQTDGTIIWKANWQVMHDAGFPTILTDHSYDYGPTGISLDCWHYGFGGVASLDAYITKTIHDITSDGIWSESTTGTKISDIYYRGNFVLALPNGKFCLLVVNATAVMHELFWDGNSWSDNVVTAVGTIVQYNAVYGENWAYSAVVDSDGNVHLVYLTNTYQVRYLKRDYATGVWSNETILFNGTRYDHDTRIVLDPLTGDIYVFIAHAPSTNHIGLCHYIASTDTWDVIIDLVNEETLGLATRTDSDDWGGLINADRKVRNNTISLSFITNKSGDGFTIKFLSLELGNHYIERVKSCFRTTTELLGALDIKSRTKSIHRTIIEFLGVLDVKSRVKSYFRTVTELLGLKDTKERIKSYFRTVTESLGLKDTKERIKSYFRTIAELLGTLDTKSRIKSYKRTIIELLGAFDAKSRIKSYYRMVVEHLGLRDAKSRTKSIHRTATELLGMLDTRSRFKSIYRTITELLGTLDTKSRIKSYFRIFIESLGLKDTKSRMKAIYREIVERLGFKDTISKIRFVFFWISSFFFRKLKSEQDLFVQLLIDHKEFKQLTIEYILREGKE